MGLTDPKPGLYRHYKGGHYRLLLVVDHHEHDGRRLVVYRSLDRGTLNARQLEKVGPDDREDCWNDLVGKSGCEEPRFRLVEEAQGIGKLWPLRIWMQIRRFSEDPPGPALECGADEPGAVLFVRVEAIPRDLDDALKQIEQARRDTNAAMTRVAELEARVAALRAQLAAHGLCG